MIFEFYFLWVFACIFPLDFQIFYEVHSVVSTNRPRGGENPLTTGVKQAVPYRTGREARYLSVSTE